MSKQPKFQFYPTLLDAFTKYLTTSAEDFFYQDADGKWHKNYNEEDGFHFSQEEVDALLLQELLDKINRKPFEPSEAASKGTIFNEIVDCIIAGRGTSNNDYCIASASTMVEFFKKVWGAKIQIDESGKPVVPDELSNYLSTLQKIDKPFIYGSIDGFEFYFDMQLCKDVAEYFTGALSQHYTTADIETDYGVVRLYGYVDELIRDKVYDIKTTKSYTFGNYQKYWQRYVYPYCLIESGDCTDIKAFEFSVLQLKGGGPRSPLITGDFYREVYDYDHKQGTEIIRQHCERFIEFLEEHRSEITDKKIFGG